MDGLYSLSSAFDLVYSKNRDDDFIDRLNHWYTSILLILFAIFISAKQYMGEPISCWFDVEFSGAWKQYAENYCWVQNTYFIPHGSNVPSEYQARSDAQLSYYQWVPYVLAIQAFLFYVPKAIWRLLNWQSGINVQDIMNKAMTVCFHIRTKPEPPKEEEKKDSEDASKTEDPTKKIPEPKVPEDIQNIAHHLELTVDAVSEDKSWFKRTIGTLLCCCVGNRQYGMYLINLYLITKVIYIVNIIGQFFLLKAFIGTSYNWFGLSILNDVINGKTWHNTGHFPLITMCDFQIRSLAQNRNYTVQCVLPINLFNEKIYIFIWFWFIIVAVVTCISLIQWFMRLLRSNRMNFITDFILKFEADIDLKSGNGKKLLDLFLDRRLKMDGSFLLYLVYLNAGDMVTKELLESLWYRHKVRNYYLINNNNGIDSNQPPQNDDEKSLLNNNEPEFL